MTPEMAAAIMLFVTGMEGTPYVPGGNTPAGTDCSGLASWIANIASWRDAFSGRFSTADEGPQLAARGFAEGTAPNALVVGWNAHHTAVTLPDGTAVSSGEGGGISFGGGGAYQGQFTRRMFLPLDAPPSEELPPPLPEDAPPPLPEDLPSPEWAQPPEESPPPPPEEPEESAG
jgi:hypothetical protein